MSQSIKVRDALSKEAEFLSALALRSKAHWGYSENMLSSFAAELTIQPQQINSDEFEYVVAENSSAVIGFYAIVKESSTLFELEALFIDPEHIGQGIGRLLMQHAVASVRKKGGEILVIQGDPNAEAFYLAAGGKQTGDRESESIPGRFLPLFEIDVQHSTVDVD